MSDSDGERIVFLHGMGVGPDSWQAQLTDLPDGFEGFAPSLVGMAEDDEAGFTLVGAADGVISELDRRGISRAHVCGLSLGAMVAVQVALDHPHRVASLVLSGGQVRPPRALMALQSALTSVLPARLVAPDGTSKQRISAVQREVARIDFRDRLSAITAPTLVLCGSRDKANLPGSRALAAGIAQADLRIIDGGGHELNTQQPDAFTAELTDFLAPGGTRSGQ